MKATQTIYALCSNGMHNKFKVEVKSVFFWLGKQATHEATAENIALFISQVPFDERVCIYTDSNEGELHSAHVPLYTNGAVSVDAIEGGDGLLWNKFDGSMYIINPDNYILCH